MFRDEVLVDVEDGLHADALFDHSEPGAHGGEQLFRATVVLNLAVGGLHVEHGRQVAWSES